MYLYPFFLIRTTEKISAETVLFKLFNYALTSGRNYYSVLGFTETNFGSICIKIVRELLVIIYDMIYVIITLMLNTHIFLKYYYK